MRRQFPAVLGDWRVMSDPYFQPLFAERIGGVELRQRDRDLQVREDQAGQAEGAGRSSRAVAGRLWHRRERRDGPGVGPPQDGRGDQPAREPRLHGQRHRSASRKRSPASCSGTSASTLDPATQVNHCIGSKPALAMLPACFINPGDVTLMTVPGYPVAGTHTRYYGGSVFRLPLLAENDFFPDFASDPAPMSGPRPSCWCSTIPTARPARRRRASSTSRSIALAKQHEFVVVQDAAHSLLSYDQPPSSFLAVPGAMDVGVEVHSLSKGFDMIGWRIGWVCGHERIVRAFADVKDNSDCGQFGAIQNAAPLRARRRRDSRPHAHEVQAAAGKAGRHAQRAAAFSARCRAARTSSTRRAPRGLADGTKFETAEAASQYLHHAALDRHGAVGRRRAVPAVQRHLRSGRRSGRRRPDGRDRGPTQAVPAGVLVRPIRPERFPENSP